MLVISRFDAVGDDFAERAHGALAALAARPGFVRGRLGRAVDDPAAWVLSTEWAGVGAYRRALSSADVKLAASTLLGQGRDEPSAFEVLLAVDDGVTRRHDSDLAPPDR